MRALALIIGILFSGALWAQTNPDQSQVTSSNVVAFIRLLEQAPLSADAPSVRRNLLTWATETKDVTINVCDVLGPIPGTTVPYGPELLLQAMLGNGAFQLEHPESKGDEVKAQMAGITSMLHAYAKILELQPNARIPELDTWLVELRDGTLAERITPAIQKKCVDSPDKT
jgi:hypothetical protein